MTIRQKAYKLIDALPEDTVQLMYKMEPETKMKKEAFDFSRFVTPTERGEFGDEYVKELRANDRIQKSIYRYGSTDLSS